MSLVICLFNSHGFNRQGLYTQCLHTYMSISNIIYELEIYALNGPGQRQLSNNFAMDFVYSFHAINFS